MDKKKLFDIEYGAKIIGSKAKSIEITELLLNDIINFEHQIIKVKNNLKSSHDLIHKTLGAALYCGVPRLQFQLQSMQSKLENKLMSQDDILLLCTTISLMLKEWPNEKKKHESI